MIYSKELQLNIPVKVRLVKKKNIRYFGNFYTYLVRDGNTSVGSVDLTDTYNGVHVEYIENMNPQLYSGFGKIADQIEVEHCLRRGMEYFEILSEAGLNSHALHYLRGKRFEPDEMNKVVEDIIKNTPPGQRYETSFLGKIRMYAPQELIEKYKEIIKKFPLLK